MSLKAKIEAVIYAAEEPVTLAQLVGLLGQEAQAELERIASAQQSLPLIDNGEESLPQPAEPDELNQEVFGTAHPSDLGASSAQDDDLADVHDSAAAELVSHDSHAFSPSGSGAPPEEQGTAAAGALESSSECSPDLRQLARTEKDRARILRDYLRSLLDNLIGDYATSDRGLEIREVAGGFRLATKPEYHDVVRGFVKALKPPLKLTLQALETLAVVAYKQPVTAPEVSEIRGVDSGGVLGSLMARKLVTTAGRKPVIGRPILYKTTKDFLLRFGLKDINELPSIEEFEKMAGELADVDSVQEEIHMPRHTYAESPHTDPGLFPVEHNPELSITGANLEEERDATEPQADGDGATVETVTPDGRNSPAERA